MAEKLKELLDKINQEGVKLAEEKARAIEQKAIEDSERIVEYAHTKAQSIIEEARLNAERTTQASRIALKQASRNLILSLKEEIRKILEKIVSIEVGKALSGEDMAKVLGSLIEGFVEGGGKSSDIKILVKKEDLEKLKTTFSSKLKQKLIGGIEFKSSANINAGFSISFDRGKSFFDFTDEGLTEALSAYLSPELAKIIK